MSVKRKSYSADFKAKLVLEVLENEALIFYPKPEIFNTD
jgi:transposase-like protein